MNRKKHVLWWHVLLVAYVMVWTLASPFAVVADDVVWQLWIADQINHGFVLYRDLRETNPPLWFWLAAAVNKAQGISPFSYITTYFLSVSALAAVAVWLLWCTLADLPPAERGAWVFAATTMIFGLGWFFFGQREHFYIMFGLAYAGLASARMRGAAVPALLAATIGATAALGFSLKHYFLIAPVLLELVQIVKLRRAWRPLRSETVALGCVGLGYGGAVWMITPDYFSVMLPMVNAAYDAFRNDITMLVAPSIMAMGGLYIAVRMTALDRPATVAFVVLAFSTWIAYALQQKGWLYQELPIFIAVLTIILAAAIGTLTNRRNRQNVSVQLLFLLVAGSYCVTFGLRNASTSKAVPPFPVSLGDDRKVAWIGASGSENIQYVMRAGGNWAQGYVTVWPLLAIAQAESKQAMTPALRALAAKTRIDLLADFTCQQPDVIMVAESAGEVVYRGLIFDQLGFFTQDAVFRKFMAQYKPAGRYAHIRFYQRSAAPTPSGCRPYHQTRIFSTPF